MESTIKNNMDSYYVPDFGDEFETECMPLLKSKHIDKYDQEKLKKKLASFIDKRNKSKKNADVAFTKQKEDMNIYWDASYWHYDKQVKLLMKALSDNGIDVSDIE